MGGFRLGRKGGKSGDGSCGLVVSDGGEKYAGEKGDMRWRHMSNNMDPGPLWRPIPAVQIV